MINKEFGFKEILLHIFKLESESELNKSEYWAENMISEKGYYKIENYINTTRNEFSIFLVIGIIASFAYKDSADLLKSLSKTVEQTILDNKRLVSELDQIPDTAQYLTEPQYWLNLVYSSTFSSLADNLRNFRFRGQSVFKTQVRLHGIAGLLLGLASIHPKEFEQWYSRTERKDLKAIYINSVLNPLREEKQFASSKILFVRLYHLIIRFGIGKYSEDLKDLSLGIEDICNITEETMLNKKEKLYFILCYFRRRIYNLQNGSQIFLTENEQLFLTKNFNNLTVEIIQEYLPNFDCEIFYKAICYVKSKHKRKQLLKALIEGFSCNFSSFNNVMGYIIKAKLHGEILHKIAEESYIKEIETKFSEVYNITNVPYLAYRKPKDWGTGIKQLRCYFIIISIFYHDTDKLKLNYYEERVKSSEREFKECSSKEYELFIKDLRHRTVMKNSNK